ncbi:TlpA family protein disulfide reductase [Ancylomarina salipaludis]|uniref:TlpA family protein disulfide reductase n=1 Tax=Ancylomarina salipaludis TaxID=2501299 RepID=A0A4Q1JHZ7_9BACT|nr:TlpA disulfide reductase family protein [Ancylomarina salipaludis]RXQ88048.1 TlpA family protein disulfide reductase [Ancylomarina salipaludis]
MNKISIFLILASLWASSCGTKPNKREVIIEGINLSGNTTEIFNVANGKLETIGMQKRNDGVFFFKLACDKPAIINLGKEGYARVFVKPGDHLKVELRDNHFQVKEDNYKENQLLSVWYETLKQLKDTASHARTTYKEFFPFVESWLNSKEYKSIDNYGLDADFVSIFQKMQKNDFEHTLMRFLLTGRSVHPDMKKLPSYYDEIIKEDKFIDASVYLYDKGDDYLHAYLTYLFLKGKYNKKEDVLVQQMRYVADDTLCSFLTMGYLGRLKGMSLKLAADKYGKHLVMKEHKEILEKMLRVEGMHLVGNPGLNFSYPNIDGVKTSLSDLKGKVVVVDIWATWCAPCKKEAPYFHELEKKYHGKDVAFISISLDENKEAWEEYIKRKKPEGIQLHAPKAFSSDIAKEYKINAIPRFMVFDKEGKVVSVEAPRPSDSILKEMIDSLL